MQPETPHATTVPTMVSLSGLARRADVPYERAVRAMRAGLIKPNAIALGSYLFAEDRAEELRAVVITRRMRHLPLLLC